MESSLELGPPPALAKNGARVIALGGLGEVGRNMTVVEYGGRLLIIDCGVLFLLGQCQCNLISGLRVWQGV